VDCFSTALKTSSEQYPYVVFFGQMKHTEAGTTKLDWNEITETSDKLNRILDQSKYWNTMKFMPITGIISNRFMKEKTQSKLPPNLYVVTADEFAGYYTPLFAQRVGLLRKILDQNTRNQS